MATTTTADSIPVIDLRLLTQSEINNLALSSTNSFNLETLSDVIPKIDRSVFNESAGSRKQTYSRLPLFQKPQSETLISQSQTLDPPSDPPNPQSQPLPRRRGRPRVHPLPAAPAGPAEPSFDLDRQENLQIVTFLKKLFESRGSRSYVKSNNVNVVSSASVLDRDKEVRNGKGETVDLVVLAGKADLYGEEIRRRTDGLQTEEQLLGYMTGLDGQWGSRRKKRKVVDAAVFGDGLPKGWKILLGLKRKDGIVYLNCRRYVSPSGKQFMSCKEVSSYILSLDGQQDAGQTVSGQIDDCAPRMDKPTPGSVSGLIHAEDSTKELSNRSFIAPISHVSAECEKKEGRLFGVKNQAVAERDNSLECHKRNITFGDKDAHLQQFSTFHQRNAKRRKLGQSLTDGVIVKDGKYECQFCHKTFMERRRYYGHIGAHIRYEGLSVDASPYDTAARTNNDSSYLAVIPLASSKMNILANKHETTKSVHSQKHFGSPQCISEADTNGANHDPKLPEIPEAISSGFKVEIEHNNSAGAFGIISHASNENKIECSPKEDAFGITEAAFSENKIEYDPKEGGAEIAKVMSNSISVDRQIEDDDITRDQCQGSTKAEDFRSGLNDASQSCSPVITQEPSRIESVQNQINDCEMTGDTSGIIEDNSVQDGKHNVCLDARSPTLVEDATTSKIIGKAGLSSSKSKNVNDDNSDHTIGAYKSEKLADPRNSTSIEIAEEITSKEKIVPAQFNCDITDYKSDVMETTDAMNIQSNTCMDALTLAPSLINVDSTSYNTVDPSPCSMASMIDDCNGHQKVCEGHLFLSPSGNGPSYGVEAYSTDIFTSKAEEQVGWDTSNAEKGNTGSDQTLTNKDIGIASTTSNELSTSYIFTNIASEPTSGIETNAECMFSGDLNESLLEGIDTVDNELQDYFRDSSIRNEEAAGDIMGSCHGRQALQFTVADQASSWVQSSDSLPILDMIPDQGQDELRGTLPRNERANISGFEELRLGSIEPSDFVIFTDQASEPSEVATRSSMELFPDDQLDWGMSLTKMVNASVSTTVCVWCSREFSLEGIEPEPQSESLGYMCPDCKAKISGQLGLLNNGFS